ncbi:hypothetical protein D8911_06340 [Levilactobacillus brevis]|nr:hypothetical protein D8911_06340 [Levilactobacillus brevis]
MGGRVEPKSGLDASPLSRRTRLKDASFLTGDSAAKETPTAELIFSELSATLAKISNVGMIIKPVNLTSLRYSRQLLTDIMGETTNNPPSQP